MTAEPGVRAEAAPAGQLVNVEVGCVCAAGSRCTRAGHDALYCYIDADRLCSDASRDTPGGWPWSELACSRFQLAGARGDPHDPQPWLRPRLVLTESAASPFDPPRVPPMLALPAIASVARAKAAERTRTTVSPPGTAAMCLLVRGEHYALDEWVAYHFGIGFTSITIYDNSVAETREPGECGLDRWAQVARAALKQTGGERLHGLVVEVVPWHYQDGYQQGKAYKHCVEQHVRPQGHTWAAFFDVDEYLVLKQHRNVAEFLSAKSPPRGSLVVSWVVFGTSNHSTRDTDAPTIWRYVHRDREPHHNIKSIVRVADFARMRGNPHSAVFKPSSAGARQIDTEGKMGHAADSRTWASNPHPTVEVAALYHYRHKSQQEWKWKGCTRGSLGKHWCGVAAPAGEVFDDTAWRLLQRLVPYYNQSLSRAPPARRERSDCPSWCASHSSSWAQKCSWSSSACSRCTSCNPEHDSRVLGRHIILHIPKSGGTTLCMGLKAAGRETGRSNGCWSPGDGPEWAAQKHSSTGERNCSARRAGPRYAFIERHLDSFGAGGTRAALFCDRVRYSVLLREPIARAVSHMHNYLSVYGKVLLNWVLGSPPRTVQRLLDELDLIRPFSKRSGALIRRLVECLKQTIQNGRNSALFLLLYSYHVGRVAHSRTCPNLRQLRD